MTVNESKTLRFCPFALLLLPKWLLWDQFSPLAEENRKRSQQGNETIEQTKEAAFLHSAAWKRLSYERTLRFPTTNLVMGVLSLHLPGNWFFLLQNSQIFHHEHNMQPNTTWFSCCLPSSLPVHLDISWLVKKCDSYNTSFNTMFCHMFFSNKKHEHWSNAALNWPS